jgi:hypothetical protein
VSTAQGGGRSRRAAAKPPLTREFRPAKRLGALDPSALTARLYALYDRAGDGELGRWPGDGDLWGALRYAQLRATVLDGEEAQEAAVLRAMLAQWIREQADALQLRALEDGRAAGAPWARFTEALCVATEVGAYQRARRLTVAVHGTSTDRRSPEAAREVEDRRIRAELDRRRAEHADADRYPQILTAARALLDVSGSLTLNVGDDNELHDLAQVLPTCSASSLGSYLRLALRAVNDAPGAASPPACPGRP